MLKWTGISPSLDGAISCGGLHFGKAFGARQKKFIQIVERVGRQTGGSCPRREAHLKGDGFIYTFFKFDWISFRFLRSHPNRLLTQHVASSIDGVNSNIHHGSTSCQGLV